MESLPREILKEITKRLSFSCVAYLAQTCKSFNGSIWSLITTLDEDDLKKIKDATRLAKLNNLESLLLHYDSGIVPQDLSKLTTLQKLLISVAHTNKYEIKEALGMLQTLTNLRELTIAYGTNSIEKLDDLLGDHTRLTTLIISADDLQRLATLDPFSWKIMTRLRELKLKARYSRKVPSDFFANLWTLTQLRGLGLRYVFLDQPEPETGLSKLINLEELELYECSLRERGDSKWMFNYNELLDLKKLTKLDLMDARTDQQLVDITANMTQLVELDIFELENNYNISSYSNLKNLTQLWLILDSSKMIVGSESDPGPKFSQMPNLEALSVPWCPNVTQLVHLKKLRELYLLDGPYYPHDDQMLNFLNGLSTVKILTMYDTQLPSDGIVDMKGMTSLEHLEIMTLTFKELPHKFVQGLSVLPSLASLDINWDITQELLQTIVTTLTQLRTLRLSKAGRSLFKDDTTKESALPSLKDFSFQIEFAEY